MAAVTGDNWKRLAATMLLASGVGVTNAQESTAQPAASEDFPALDCLITPSQSVDLSSPVPGVLSQVLVERGDRVSRGQVVAEMASEVEQATVELARVRAAIDSEIQLQQVNLEFDRLARSRIDSIPRVEAVAEQERDEAERQVALSRLKRKQAEEIRRVRHYELKKAEAQLEQKRLRSPIDGLVLKRFRSAGEYVENQPVARLVQLDPLYVEAIAPLSLFGRIGADAKGMVYLEGLGERQPVAARVVNLDPAGDAASGTFGVRLALPNPGLKIAAGLKCSVRISPQRAKSVTAESALAPLPAPAPASRPQFCQRTGPFENRMEAERIALEWSEQNLQSQAISQVREQPNGYIVLVSPSDDLSLDGLQERLRTAGVSDSLRMAVGPYQGDVSVGVYAGPRLAAERVTSLQRLGFSARSVQRTGQLSLYWIESRFATGDQARLSRLVQELNDPTMLTASCDSETAE